MLESRKQIVFPHYPVRGLMYAFNAALEGMSALRAQL